MTDYAPCPLCGAEVKFDLWEDEEVDCPQCHRRLEVEYNETWESVSGDERYWGELVPVPPQT